LPNLAQSGNPNSDRADSSGKPARPAGIKKAEPEAPDQPRGDSQMKPERICQLARGQQQESDPARRAPAKQEWQTEIQEHRAPRRTLDERQPACEQGGE